MVLSIEEEAIVAVDRTRSCRLARRLVVLVEVVETEILIEDSRR